MKRLVFSGLAGLLATIALAAQAPKPVAPAPTDSKAAPAAKAAPAKPAAKPAVAPKPAPVKGPTNSVAVLQTKLGKIVIKFFPDKAPNHVKSFESLVKSGFYNGTKFHRVIPGFMIQGGDPNTKKPDESMWGQGDHEVNGKPVNVNSEFSDIHHARGIVSMARANDPNSASCQFFICVADAGFLDGKYSVFGEVIEGMEVVDKIVGAPTKMGGDGAMSLPLSPVAIDKATLEARPAAAKAATPTAPPAPAPSPAPVTPAPATPAK